MITQILKDLLVERLGILKPSSKNWKKRNCFLCRSQGHGVDTRSRFGVKFEASSITCNCFNCGFSAYFEEGGNLTKNFKFMLVNLGVDDKFIKSIEFEIYKQQNKLEVVRDGAQLTESEKEFKIRNLATKWPEIKLPDGALPITTWLEYDCDDADFLQVVNYLMSRRIFNLDEFYWCSETKHQLNKRVIIPYYYNRKLVGFTARYAEDLKTKTIPKYYQICPEDFVYNLDSQEGWQRKYIILTEGVLDAWTVSGISSLGEINQAKIDIINRLQKTIIVCPDRDRKGKDLVDAAIVNNWHVSFPKWDRDIKDAAKAAERYGRLLTTHSIIASALHGKERIQINWEIEQNVRNKRLQQ